ncbi:hypothetical protein [Nocardia sp. 348MFTsu5.1]|uniref:hypothetical protein n=1 Tax=Nocardia sp. 348MFTsu5.1 TaxID=1172185 RepID=UPI0012DE5877
MAAIIDMGIAALSFEPVVIDRPGHHMRNTDRDGLVAPRASVDLGGTLARNRPDVVVVATGA